MPFDAERLRSMRDELDALRAALIAAEVEQRGFLDTRPEPTRKSVRNLIHYLALRRREIRPLQQELARLGLSSLGRTEAHVMSSVEAVLRILRALTNEGELVASEGAPTFEEGTEILERATDALLGPSPHGRSARIMVTLPSEAAVDPSLVRSLLRRGTNLVRINCAHDGPAAWERMILHVRAASEEMATSCRVVMDLGGPKVRTGPVAEDLVLAPGDSLWLVDSAEVGRGPSLDPTTGERLPARVGCTLPRALDFVQVGHQVWLDDGKIGGVVADASRDGVLVRIVHSRPRGRKLGADKGINFPDTELVLDAMTDQDREHLPFVAKHADVVGLSFVQRPSDVAEIERRLAELDEPRARALGMILKIETRAAFAALPSLLLATTGRRPVGVMIARGDLAVEVGYERLAEVQEEMLWLSEAAHVPVVWATQVLEHLAKKGRPTRAEVTDAAMSERAECVMLNKGLHVEEAVSLLDGVLRRMESHQRKKRSLLRPLSVSRVV